MHYLLYVPHEQGKNLGTPQQALENLGLGDLVAGHEGRVCAGPNDCNQGHLVAWRKPGKNERCHYNAGEQTWIPAVANGPDGEGKGRYWVGFWNDSPVTPEDLQRPYSKPGKSVELGDGNSWRFPIIGELPRDLILQDDGTWKFELQRQYYDLYLQALELDSEIQEKGTINKNYGDVLMFCMGGLSQNYRFLPEVVSHLRLFSTENIKQALGVLLELELK